MISILVFETQREVIWKKQVPAADERGYYLGLSRARDAQPIFQLPKNA